MNEEKWHLPENIDVTKNPDAMAKAVEYQKQLAKRASSPFARLSPQEATMSRALRMVEHFKREHTRMQERLDNPPQGSSRQQRYEMRKAQKILGGKIAEQYAIMGHYDTAMEYETRPEHKAVWSKIHMAIERPDHEFCNCPPGRDFIRAEIFSAKHGRVVTIRSCSGCHIENAGPLPPHLAARKMHEKQAQLLVGGMHPNQAAVALKGAGHTSDKLLSK